MNSRSLLNCKNYPAFSTKETKRLLNDSAAEASKIKRFEDLGESDEERHNSQVESLGKELDTKSLEIGKMKQIGHRRGATKPDVTKHEQELDSNRKSMEEKHVARNGEIAKDQHEVQRLAQELSSNKEAMKQLQEKHDATLCEIQNELPGLWVKIRAIRALHTAAVQKFEMNEKRELGEESVAQLKRSKNKGTTPERT